MGISNRLMEFCPTLLSNYGVKELLSTCDSYTGCGCFICICCPHIDTFENPESEKCHHYPVAFVDSACFRNGSGGGQSGIGGAMGEKPEHQWSITIDETIDSNPLRTNQRAELLAAIQGIHLLGLAMRENEHFETQHDKCLVVASDSEYICKGVTEWMPKWKNNGWHNSSGKPVSNKDLFCKLDEAVCSLEQCGVDVGFYWIPREANTLADSLAKAACAGVQVPEVFMTSYAIVID